MPITDAAGREAVLLTIDEVCAVLRIGRTSVYQLFRAGELTPVHPRPRVTVVARDDVEAYIERIKVEASEGAA